MNTTVETIQEYIKKTYNLDFRLQYLGTHREIVYKNGKKEYSFICGYAQSNPDDPYVEYWSIFEEFFDKNKWYGSGSARIDKGIITVDNIMKEWGFKKQNQTNIFDFIGSE